MPRIDLTGPVASPNLAKALQDNYQKIIGMTDLVELQEFCKGLANTYRERGLSPRNYNKFISIVDRQTDVGNLINAITQYILAASNLDVTKDDIQRIAATITEDINQTVHLSPEQERLVRWAASHGITAVPINEDEPAMGTPSVAVNPNRAAPGAGGAGGAGGYEAIPVNTYEDFLNAVGGEEHKWSLNDESTFNQYRGAGNIYVIKKNGKLYACVHKSPDKITVQNVNDVPLKRASSEFQMVLDGLHTHALT